MSYCEFCVSARALPAWIQSCIAHARSRKHGGHGHVISQISLQVKYKMEKRDWDAEGAKLRETIRALEEENARYRADNKAAEFEAKIQVCDPLASLELLTKDPGITVWRHSALLIRDDVPVLYWVPDCRLGLREIHCLYSVQQPVGHLCHSSGVPCSEKV